VATPPIETPVLIEADIGRKTHRWEGRIVRVGGAIDTQSRQLFVVAQVDDPYARGPEGRPPLRIGQFVGARIQGRPLADVFVLPREALREGGEVLIVDKESRLQRRPVTVVWSDGETAVISDGLADGDVVTLTSLSVAASGSEVLATIDGVAPLRNAAADAATQ
jgi:multidrug efflux pump subunit AcrA (membrane-fusion protein)